MRIALLISGGGTTAAAILNACKTGRLKQVEPVLAVASSDDISGIEKVRQAEMENDDIIAINPKNFPNAELFGEKILRECERRRVEFLGQYGWLCRTPKNVIAAYPKMMVNQHPGPLDPGRPDFGGRGMFGKRVHAARLEFARRTNRDFWSEATAQRVAENFDEGAVVGRQQVKILPDDTPETLAERILPVEHELQIQILEKFARGQVKELRRDQPLIKPEEIKILEDCKSLAIKNYPKG